MFMFVYTLRHFVSFYRVPLGELTHTVVMETHWPSTVAGVCTICILLTLSSALPTDPERDTAVRIQQTNNGDPPVAAAESPKPAAMEPSYGLHTDTGTKQIPASPSATQFAPSVGSSETSSLNSPFTNHFVLDTASLDLNGNGCIDGEPELDLFKYHVATALAGTPNNMLRAHSIVHRTDTNKDGRICWCDFISIYLHDKDEVNERHHSAPFVVILDKDNGMFSRLDDDKDGMLKGSELESLIEQFASCIPEEQARLIVAAMTGLGVRDGAISSKEFARFLGVDSSKMPAPQAAVDESQPAPALPAGNGQQQKQQSGISGVLLTSTALPQTSRSAVDSLMKATKRE
ncbi:hypothetical protein RRG08_049728 [Elysia crispata]|uniref:Uncharacterized protein n=1 Tax=Elysia crispata TaxID=231223 RepID=A0AAE0Y850_9GAST|nr:hypothetical protein RRG08_049728 [Elysia crispata]